MCRTLVAPLLVLAIASASADILTDVDGIAEVIEANYFDPARAAAIADDLRTDAQAGDFDRYPDRGELAAALTQRLRKLDGHFGVHWGAQDSRARRGGMRIAQTRQNYGFKRVERLPGNLAYLELTFVADIDFDDASSPARRAADAALTLLRGADGVILDLRNNGGGAPSMVGYLVSAFVEPDADVYNTFHSREGTETERPAAAYSPAMLDVPLYVLTSRGTASAAESIAFTLQSAQRATVVGERSAGAANPGQTFDSPQGYVVFVSTGSPRNPINGRNWEGGGVRPDVEVAGDAALMRAREIALTKILSGAIEGAPREDARSALEALDASQ